MVSFTKLVRSTVPVVSGIHYSGNYNCSDEKWDWTITSGIDTYHTSFTFSDSASGTYQNHGISGTINARNATWDYDCSTAVRYGSDASDAPIWGRKIESETVQTYQSYSGSGSRTISVSGCIPEITGIQSESGGSSVSTSRTLVYDLVPTSSSNGGGLIENLMLQLTGADPWVYASGSLTETVSGSGSSSGTTESIDLFSGWTISSSIGSVSFSETRNFDYTGSAAYWTSVRGIAITGTQTESGCQRISYSASASTHLEANSTGTLEWFYTSVSGLGSGSISSDYGASGTGSYSASFNDGQGTLYGSAAHTTETNDDDRYSIGFSLSSNRKTIEFQNTGSHTIHNEEDFTFNGSGSISSASTTATGGTTSFATLSHGGEYSIEEDKTVNWSRVHDLYSGNAHTVASYSGSGNYVYLAGGNSYSDTSSPNSTTHSESSWERGISEDFTSQNTITKNWSFSGISNVAQTTSDSWDQYSQCGSAAGSGCMYTSGETESSTSTSTQGNGWTSFSWSWCSGTNTAEDLYNYSANWQESYNDQTATYGAELTVANHVTGEIEVSSASGGGYSYTHYGSGSGSGSGCGMGSGTGSGSTSSSSWEFHSNGTGCLDTDYNELLTYTGFRWSTYVNSTIFPTHPTGAQVWYHGMEAGTGCNANDYISGYGIAFLGEVAHMANANDVASLQIIADTSLPSMWFVESSADGDFSLFPEADFSRFCEPNTIIDIAVDIEGPSLLERLQIWFGNVIEASGLSDLEIIHTTLDVIGLIPVFGDAADFVNGCIYMVEGEWSKATISFASAIPGAGVGVTVAKWGKNSLKAMGASAKVTSKVSCAMGTHTAKIPAIATAVASCAEAKTEFANGDYLSAGVSLLTAGISVRSLGNTPSFCFVADTQVVIDEAPVSTVQFVHTPDMDDSNHDDSMAPEPKIHEQYAYVSISLWSACFFGMMGAGWAFATLYEERKRQLQAHCFATYEPQDDELNELSEEMMTDQAPIPLPTDRAEILTEVISEMDHLSPSETIPLKNIHPILLPRHRLRIERNHTNPINHPSPSRFRRTLQAICLFVMVFCTYGLFAFFPTSLTKQSNTTTPPLTSVSANVPPDTLSSPTPSAPAAKRYITKSIQDIHEGDLVYAYDIETGEVSRRPVTSVVSHQADHIRHLTVQGDSGIPQTFQTTDTHPFWVIADTPNDLRRARENVTVETARDGPLSLYHANIDASNGGYYVEASDLQVGDTIISPSGEQTTLFAMHREEHPEDIPVYNFEVDGTDNCYIITNCEAYLAVAEPVLVHNARCSVTIRRFMSKSEYRKARTEGLQFDRTKGNGIPATARTIRASHPDRIRGLTGARKADYYIDFDITGIQHFRKDTGGGLPEYVIQGNVGIDRIIGWGRVQ